MTNEQMAHALEDAGWFLHYNDEWTHQDMERVGSYRTLPLNDAYDYEFTVLRTHG